MDVIEVAPGQLHTPRERYDGSGSTPGDLCGENMRVGVEMGSVVPENVRSEAAQRTAASATALGCISTPVKKVLTS